jgi:hypothetical protein
MSSRACCTITDCRRTGLARHDGRPFVCGHHWATAGAAILKDHRFWRGQVRRKRLAAKVMEQAAYDKVVADIVARNAARGGQG